MKQGEATQRINNLGGAKSNGQKGPNQVAESKLQLADNFFDDIYYSQAPEPVLEDRRAMMESYRILKPG